jgi:hypothetical protein
MYFVGLFFATIIEVTSALDFYSDIVVVGELGNSTDTAWFTFSLFTILAPYYTIYSSLINQLLKLVRKNEKSNICGMLVNLLIILPSMLVLLILMDIVYMSV